MWWIPLMAAGIGLQARGQLQQGKAAEVAGAARQQAANYEAAQLRVQSGQVIAASQRQAQEERRKSTLLQSRALALAAASGAGASDHTVVDIISDIAAEGAYRASVALYEGKETARGLRMQADATQYSGEVSRAEGKAGQDAYQLAALGSLLSGGASLYEKYSR